jgi:hypothetical protein
MIPLLETGVSLATTKGFDFLMKQSAATKRAKHFLIPPKPDGAAEYVLAALAIAPQLINVFGPSPVTERFYAMTLKQLYWLHKARPFLEGVSMAALAGLAYRQRSEKTQGRALQVSKKATMALRFAATMVSAPTAFAPHDDGHLVITAREVGRRLKADDLVIGLFLNNEARCYPLEILRKPHLIHDTVGGIPVVPTYCELSNSAIAYRDEWRGERLELNVAASPNGNVAFYEATSDGMIQQLDGAIGAGPNEGAILQTFPVALTTWRQWREMHPQTTGVWFEQGAKSSAVTAMLHGMDLLDKRQKEPLFKVRGGVDPRLPAKTEVFGVRIKGQSCAFTRDALRKQPVQNLDLAGEPIVILYDERHDVAACYSRRLDDRTLALKEVRHGQAIAEDSQGRLWEVGGRLADSQEQLSLRPAAFAADKVRWFAWAHFNPGTDLKGQVAKDAEQPVVS